MKKFLNFKLIILVSLMMVFIGIFIPLNAFALDNQYITSGQFDESEAEKSKFKIGNKERGGSYSKLTDFKVDDKTVGGMISKALGIILTIVRTIALGWGIIMAIAIAMKYMTGSPQVKSQLKTDMPTYIIGALLLFGAAGLLTLLQVFTEDVIVMRD